MNEEQNEERKMSLNIPVVWTPYVKIRVIDDSVLPPVWKTLAECTDTPRFVKKTIETIRKSHPKACLWMHHFVENQLVEKEYVG